jgi:hypothetical protein
VGGAGNFVTPLAIENPKNIFLQKKPELCRFIKRFKTLTILHLFSVVYVTEKQTCLKL